MTIRSLLEHSHVFINNLSLSEMYLMEVNIHLHLCKVKILLWQLDTSRFHLKYTIKSQFQFRLKL